MPDLIQQPAFEIGRRLEIRGQDSWFAVVASGGEQGDALTNFTLDLESTLGVRIRQLSIQGQPLAVVRKLLARPPTGTVILTGFETFDPTRWTAWDINRSGLVRPGPIVLWLSAKALTDLCRNAPNIRSFIGASMFALSPSGEAMTEAEVRARTQELETHYRMRGEEVIECAVAGNLPPDPQFVEWLILLGRGDLV
jgi:hypothetical protein